MIESKWLKYVEPNLHIYQKLNGNKKNFTNTIIDSYPELNKEHFNGLYYFVKIYFNGTIVESKDADPIKKEINIEDVIQEDRKIRALNSKLQDLNKKNIYLLEKLTQQEQLYDDLLSIKEPIDIFKIEKSPQTNTSRAIPIICLSDWHLEENVLAGQVSGFNEYNLKVAEKRAFTIFQNILKCIKKESNDISIEDCIIWLGGDFISGYIHDELIESNNLSPIEATRFAKRLLISGIEFLLKHSKLNFTIPCSIGNHSRTTKKMMASTGYKNNYEFGMYCDLQDYFAKEKRIKFHIPISDDCYIEAFGKTLRFFHGDALKYGGGIGGLSVPLIKYLHRKDEQRKADFTFLGHFHQLLYPTQASCVNGSLIGLSAYGYKIGFKPERPAQAFTLLDEKRGITIKIPIFAE
jgi:hypothetical protein